MSSERYRLIGSTASPYAIKLRALMRYRRIPFDWVIMTKALRKQIKHLRPNLIPVLQYPDGTFRGDSTALAYDLEARHPERSVIPVDRAVAFVCDLLEDLADEWAVKPLFLNLAAFEPHVGMSNYLFGSRPSLADFAWFGQLSEIYGRRQSGSSRHRDRRRSTHACMTTARPWSGRWYPTYR
jgi:glutathione S-transferase